jgi:hypothetical protein
VKTERNDLREMRANAVASHYLLPPKFLEKLPSTRAWAEEQICRLGKQDEGQQLGAGAWKMGSWAHAGYSPAVSCATNIANLYIHNPASFSAQMPGSKPTIKQK